MLQKIIPQLPKKKKILITKKEKSTKDTKTSSTSNETTGRIEVSRLNIKEDIASSQIKYTSLGLNEVGNTVIYTENNNYMSIEEGTEIYIRNSNQEKVLYTVFNTYKTSLSDTSFYEKVTNQTEITLVVKINESEVLVIEAKNN